MRIDASPSTWVCSSVLVLLAASTLLSRPLPGLPGPLEFAVLVGPGATRTRESVQPLADYLSGQIRRPVVLRCLEADELAASEPPRAEIVLAWGALAERWPGAEVLAWAKGRAVGNPRPRPFAIYPRDKPWNELNKPRIILGDAVTWAGGRGARDYLAAHGFDDPSDFGAYAHGSNPYDHHEVLAALAHGAFDVAVVREVDARAALDTGLLPPEAYEGAAAGTEGSGFALIAAPELPELLRRQIRDAVLGLDVLRYEASNLRVALVLQGLAGLGLRGFAPNGILPSLLP